MDPEAGKEIVIEIEQNGRVEKVGVVPKEQRTDLYKKMDELGVDTLPATISLGGERGRLFPEVGVTKPGEARMNIDITADSWKAALIVKERINETAMKRQQAMEMESPARETEGVNDWLTEVENSIAANRGLGDQGGRGGIAYTMGKVMRDPYGFNEQLSKDAKGNPLINADLVKKIKKSPEKVTVIEVLQSINNAARKSGRTSQDGSVKGAFNSSPEGKNVSGYVDGALVNRITDATTGAERNLTWDETNTRLHNMRKPLSDWVNKPGTAQPQVAAEISRRKKLAERAKNEIAEKANKIKESFQKGKVTYKKPEEMTVAEAKKAPKDTFEAWERSKKKNVINGKDDINDTVDLFNAYLGRGEAQKAKGLLDKTTLNKEAGEDIAADFVKMQKGMASKLGGTDIQAEIKKSPAPEKKVKRAMAEKEKIKEQVKKKTPPKDDPVDDNRQLSLFEEYQRKDSTDINEEIRREQENLMGMENEVAPDGVKIENPENISDPRIREEAYAYNDYFAFDAEGKLTSGGKLLKENIDTAREVGDVKRIQEIEKDMMLLDKKHLKKRSQHFNRKYKGDFKKGFEGFLKEIDSTFKKYGDTKSFKQDNNVQMLKHRYIYLLTNKPRRIFSVKTTEGGVKRMVGSTDVSERPASDLDVKLRNKIKENPDYETESIYFDPRGSDAWLNPGTGKRKGLNDIISMMEEGIRGKDGKQQPYVFMGLPKNSLQSIWGLKLNPKYVEMFDKNPKKYLPEEMWGEVIRLGETPKLSDQTKFLRVFAVDVLGMAPGVSSKVMHERAGLYDSKWPKNMAHQGKDYNLVVVKGGEGKTVGETTGKTFEQFFNDVKGDRKSAEDLYNKKRDDGSDDGAFYITEELAADIGFENGLIGPVKSIKPTQSANYTNKNGEVKALLQKGLAVVADRRTKAQLEEKMGRKMGKYDIVTNMDNIKLGLEGRVEGLEAGLTKTIEQKVPADSFRLRWEKPHEMSGSFGIHAFSKLPAGSGANKYVSKMMREPIRDWRVFNELLDTKYADGDHIINTFNQFIEKYHIDIPTHLYSEIVGSIKAGAGTTTHNRRLENILAKLYEEKILKGGFLKKDYLKIIPDNRVLDGEYLPADGSMMSLKTFRQMFGPEIKGDVITGKEGFLVWKNTGKPVYIASVRYPINSVDNISRLKIYLGENYNVHNLGRSNIMLSHMDVYGRKNGDYDGDTSAIFAIGKEYGMLPEGLGDIIAKQAMIIPKASIGEKRAEKPLSAEGLKDLAKNVWVGQDAINNSAAASRVMEMYQESGARFVATGDGVKQDRVVNLYYGNSKKPVLYKHKVKQADGTEKEVEGPVIIIDHKKTPLKTPQPDIEAVVNYGDEGRALAKSINGMAVDAAKTNDIYNLIKEQNQYLPGKRKGSAPEQSGMTKEMMFRMFFRETGKDRLDDPSVLQAIAKVDKEFQVPHKLSKGDKPADILDNLGKKADLMEGEIPPSKLKDLETAVNEVLTLNETIESRGGILHPALEVFQDMAGYKAPADRAADLKLQYESDTAGGQRVDTLFEHFNISKTNSQGYEGMADAQKKNLLKITELVSKTTDQYSKYKTKEIHNYDKWNAEREKEYNLYKMGADKYKQQNPEYEIQSEAEWSKRTSSPNQVQHRPPNQTYEQYREGDALGMTQKEYFDSIAGEIRKKMVLELKRLDRVLTQVEMDKLINFLITDQRANIKSHPKWRAHNDNKGANMVWRYDEIIPRSPAQARVYYKTKENLGEFSVKDAEMVKEELGAVDENLQRTFFERKDGFVTEEAMATDAKDEPLERETIEDWGKRLRDQLKEEGAL
ncbi:MAG TPA: hypothetical protein VMV74_10885, partial [Bacteroidales bacterium]|nr:hypothetical protein [Bacteroidales bacterium]